MSSDSAYAAAPFDHAKADIILRSSDNIDFRVFKLFLSLASPFFETLFNIPQPAEADKDEQVRDGLTVIPVTENSKTLDTLLCFCYPCTLVEDPKLEVLRDLVKVLDAARKYSLDTIERKVLEALSNPQILEAEPLRCFAIARRGRAREATLLAAKYTLAQPLVPSWFQEIDLITAADLLALLSYHQRCGAAVYALRTDRSWFDSRYGRTSGCPWLPRDRQDHSGSCLSKESTSTQYLPKWWLAFMDETFEALRDKPCKTTIDSFPEKTVKRVRNEKCQTCSINISEGMREFSELLTKKIEEVISKVRSVTIAWTRTFAESLYFSRSIFR